MKKNRTNPEIRLWIFRRKTFLMMKFTLLLLLCSLWQVKAEVFSQRRVNMSMKEVTLEKVFKELSRQVNCDFLYNHSVVKQKGYVTVEARDQELNQLLDHLLPQLGMEYVVDENVIIIRERMRQPEPQNEGVELKGVVKDATGQLLPGVTVRIKGTNFGTSTTAQGVFRLKIPGSQDIVLVFSFVGMKTEEIRFAGQKELEVILYEDKNEMEEVVVTGYQVLDKRTLTSSIATIQADQLEKMGTLTVDQMLEGKVPGLMVTNLSAQPGAAAKVRVRASGTFTGSREPLWVIDGVIYEDPVPLSASEINSLDNVNLIGNAITGLNPQDIESINVLKDASATAIYGTRAANGVIVITTRRGKVGSAVISYSGTMNVVNRPQYSNFNLMNSKERIDVSREIYQRGLGYPQSDMLLTPQAYEKALLDYWKSGNFLDFQQEVTRLEALNYDWFDELYRPALNHTHSLNVSGGTDSFRYYFSVGYDNQRGTEKGVDLDRITSRANIDINLRKNLLLSFGMDGSVQKAEYNHNSVNIFDAAYYTSRAVEARDEAGQLVYTDKLLVDRGANYPRQYGRYNILNERDNSERRIDNKAYNFNVTVNWDVIKGIKLSSRFAYRNTTNLTEEWIKENTYYMAQLRGYDQYSTDLDKDFLQRYTLAPYGGIYSGGQTSQEAMSIRNQLNLVKILDNKHVFNLNITQEASTTKYRGATNWEAPGYVHDSGRKFLALPSVTPGINTTGFENYDYQSVIKWLNSDRANGHSIYPAITENLTNMMSWAGIFTYSYSDKYVANFNIRSDGSNAFGQYERYKFKPSWSVSARWNLHKENFLQQAELVNELALRCSYGFRGTSPSATPYLTLSNYGQHVAEYMPEYTANLSAFPNANLRWEKTATVNGGLNFSLLGNRLFGSLDYAYSKSTDLLLNRPVSLVNGTSNQVYNGGSKEDHTIELDIHGELVKKHGFRWNVNFNLTHLKENVLTGTNIVPGQVTMQNYLSGNIIMAGFPVDGFFSYKFGGLDQEGYPTFPELFRSYNSSYEKLQNILVYEGNRNPKAYGGFGTEVGYKGFTLSAYFSYKLGQKVRLLNLYSRSQSMPLSGDNMRNEFVDRWREPGDEDHTNIPLLTNEIKPLDGVEAFFKPYESATLWQVYNMSNERVARGNFIRWQSLTLSYQCPQKFLKTIGLKSLILRMQMQNIAVWAFDKKLNGQDPEQVNHLGLPTLPSYNIGLNISF